MQLLFEGVCWDGSQRRWQLREELRLKKKNTLPKLGTANGRTPLVVLRASAPPCLRASVPPCLCASVPLCLCASVPLW